MKLTIPNQLTILRILLTPVFLYFYLQTDPIMKLTGTIVFIIAAATDWYDGYAARRLNIITRWGQFMDPLADKILISSAIIVFAYMGYLFWWMVWIIVVRDFLITFLRMYALRYGKSVVTSQTAKWKTTLQMTAVFLLLLYSNFNIPRVVYPPPYTNWITLTFLGVTLLTAFTGMQYLVENRIHLFEIWRRMSKIIR
jgi:CDP-diacylglycerol--glycerol-3-phosphate 3-phosphatidyltransferase